ncbi:hypothetical protein Pelo_12628 [Pelomyxa schiedti]|nr:hypothetical protein Pelo_12628 [Pelomyxa schiedti]
MPGFGEELHRTSADMILSSCDEPRADRYEVGGADPNVKCLWEHEESTETTPMILDVIINQKELAETMAKRGGLLPCKTAWRKFNGPHFFHIVGTMRDAPIQPGRFVYGHLKSFLAHYIKYALINSMATYMVFLGVKEYVYMGVSKLEIVTGPQQFRENISAIQLFSTLPDQILPS